MPRGHVPVWALAVAGVVFLYLVVPVVVVIMAGLSGDPNPGAVPVQGEGSAFRFPPEHLSFRYTQEFLASNTYRNAYVLALGMAVASTVIGTTLTFLGGIAFARSRIPGRRAWEALLLSPIVVPGMLIGFALLIFTRTIGGHPSFWTLVTATVVVTAPYAFAGFVVALSRVDTTPELVARTLGAGPVRAFTGITLPTLRPVIVGLMLVVFILSFGVFDVVLFLSGSAGSPLSVALYTSLIYRFDPSAAGAGVFSIGLVLTVTLVILLIAGRQSLWHFGREPHSP